MSRKSSFNLDRFYQDLQRVESSLGKTDFRKTANSPLVKEASREEKKPLAAFKKELNRKELAKTKINLDIPYEQLRVNRPDHKQDSKSNYRFSELSGESRQTDPYNNVRQRLLCWRKEESQTSEHPKDYVVSNTNSKIIQKSEVDESQYYEFLEKTMETPANEHQEGAILESKVGGNQTATDQLLKELNNRNEIYQSVKEHCGLERSYYRKEDLAITLQDHFRQHRTMQRIIQQFKRICELDVSDLNQLYAFLCEGRQGRASNVSAQSQEELL